MLKALVAFSIGTLVGLANADSGLDMLVAINAVRADTVSLLCRHSELDYAARLLAVYLSETRINEETASKMPGLENRIKKQTLVVTNPDEIYGVGMTTADSMVGSWKNNFNAVITGNFTFIGVGHVINPDSEFVNYWVVTFATIQNEACNK
ncbi:hypothetical protein CCR75_009795 [Bremia lactucae]|uniref:SCP domain-containing protein n=1 Tax=Bremia lactucae TaxID=4779 RepID=A0A976FFG8_BRELC|nr:hypothetical protein CCR75_009795 [Bremia lactucae]